MTAGAGQPARPAGWWRLPVAVAGGLLLWAAFPRLSWRPLAPVAVALLLIAVRRTRPRVALGLGVAFGLAFFVPLLSWLQVSGGTNAWLMVAVLEALYLGLLAVVLSLVARLPGWPVWTAAAWVGVEALRGRTPFGGLTWGRLGFSQDAGPLLPWASVGGPALVTFLIALVAALAVAVGDRRMRRTSLFGGVRRRRGVGVAMLLCAAAVPAVGPLLPGLPAASRQVTVALVQGNVPRLGLGAFEQRMRVLRNHAEATAALALRVEAGSVPRPDFVVWPENSTDIDPRSDPEVAAVISAAVERVGVPVLVGAVLDRPDGRVENAGMVFTPGGEATVAYVKRHLVPYGEYVPFRRLLSPVFGRLALIPRDFVPGEGRAVFPIDGAQVGDVICFEVSYDGLVRDAVRRGAELLVVQTNNATFGRSALTDQQLAMSKVRAVEHGRSVLVAATSGISAVVAPDGRVAERTGLWEQDVIVRPVPLATSRTLATRVGGWPELVLTLVGLAAAVAGVVVRRG